MSRLSHLRVSGLVLTTALAGIAACANGTPVSQQPATPTLPFKLEIVEVASSTMPAIHSFTAATADGKWLVFGGRIAGLHGFGSGNNFPRSTANTSAYVIDPAANLVVGSVDLVQSLPAQLAGPLTATNQQAVQIGTSLYTVGGYGQDLQAGTNSTFGSIIKVDVPGLMQAIAKKTPIGGYFTQNPSPDNRLRVTGGGLKQANGTFYLVFGQDFTGEYSVENRDYNRAGGQFQKYTEKVRVFTLNGDLSIATFTEVDGGYDANLPYHRRDLNLADIMQSDGTTPGAIVYGGVFRAGQVAGFTVPIDITFATTAAATTVTVRNGFDQALNHYDAADVTIFDKASASSYTTLLGGISQFHYDAAAKTLVRDQIDLAKGVDGLPFIDTISTIQRGPNATFSQFIQPFAMPGLLGTDTEFLYSGALKSGGQLFDNGVINLAALSGRTLAGHMLGGIESAAPYSALATKQPATWTSRRLFQIYVTPGTTPVLAMPALPTGDTPYAPPQ